MFVNGTKKDKIEFLTEFYEKRYAERNFRFRSNELNSILDPNVLENMIIEISRHTEFRAMKFRDKEGVYFVICKL